VHVFVLAYGSLARASGAALPCQLLDHRRTWGVAMDNRLTIPGYKVYVDPLTGEQPPVYVAFLDVRPELGARVNAVAFPVDTAELDVLDRRERQYERRDVTDLVDADLGGRVWAYVGHAEARRRYEAGRTDGTAVVARQYLEGVRAGFATRGALAAFERTTDPPQVPVRELERLEVDYSGVTYAPDRPPSTRNVEAFT
jgi:Gamma-glutamyl cyclotransferase, AIG2-like